MTPELRERLAETLARSAGMPWDEMPENHPTLTITNRQWWRDRIEAADAELTAAGYAIVRPEWIDEFIKAQAMLKTSEDQT